mmetsp:Transcript_67741/g.133229  ORF Transcript_67741/g.133229 Transcript_67741/m.133229 type:complete len:290 (+) Transcript_67741:308-1177(+)
MPEAPEVEVADRVREVRGGGVFRGEGARRGSHLTSVRIVIEGVGPERRVAAGQLVQGNLLWRPLVAVGAVGGTRRLHARPPAVEAVPDAVGIVRGLCGEGVHGREFVATHEIPIALVPGDAIPRAGALLAVIRVAHAEVHALLEKLPRGLRGDGVPEDPRDAELRRIPNDDLILQVPHNAWEVGGVDILRRVCRPTLSPVDVEREHVRVRQRHRLRRLCRGPRRRQCCISGGLNRAIARRIVFHCGRAAEHIRDGARRVSVGWLRRCVNRHCEYTTAGDACGTCRFIQM